MILPGVSLGRHATVGPVSLVMRGESVPDKTRWIGNPIGPWVDEDRRADRVTRRHRRRRIYTPVTATRRTTSPHYDLELTYKVEGNLLYGAPCSLRSPSDPIAPLDLHGLRVAKVRVDGRPVKYRTTRPTR